MAEFNDKRVLIRSYLHGDFFGYSVFLKDNNINTMRLHKKIDGWSKYFCFVKSGKDLDELEHEAFNKAEVG